MIRREFNAGVAALLVGAVVACGGDDGPAAVLNVDSNGTSTFDISALTNLLATYPLSALSTTEAASLAFMREEEQLAHDVYAVSATLWAPPIFANIAASEATHSAAIKALLDRYEQPDPLVGLPNGTFKTPAFQSLYDSLVASSRTSLISALKVGVEIEELDIRDITEQKAGIDNADILMVYDNLLRGSRNHLRAFMKILIQQGGTYVPQYISQAEFDAIVNSAMEIGG
jgi:hypothetical protein